MHIIFLSRICNKKNLLYCIELLNYNWNGKIYFDIYGTIEDSNYWDKCKQYLRKINKNVTWNYCGEVKTEDVPNVFSKYDTFLFPTKGENFGHVIFEALSVGCIPIISNTTIWNDLDENNCGYIIPLKNKELFRERIEYLLQMDHSISIISEHAINYAKEKYKKIISNSGYNMIFDNTTGNDI